MKTLNADTRDTLGILERTLTEDRPASAAHTPGLETHELPVSVRGYPCNPAGIPPLLLEVGDYVLRFARDASDLDAVCKLRFEVYNLELNEGLTSSYRTHRDIDEFDAQCHHLLVQHAASGAVVGTYRIQTGSMAMITAALEASTRAWAQVCRNIVSAPATTPR